MAVQIGANAEDDAARARKPVGVDASGGKRIVPIPPEVARRLAILSPRRDAFEKLAKEAMQSRLYASALHYFNAERTLAVELGLHPIFNYREEEIECAYQLEDYRSVLSMADQSRQWGLSPTTQATVGLALLRLGQVARAAALYSPTIFGDQAMGTEYRQYLPSADNSRDLECGFLLARGSNFFYGDPERALPDLQQAEQLVPHQPFVAFFLGDSLWHLGRLREASSYTSDAIRVGGPYSEMAQRFGEPIVHLPVPRRTTIGARP